MATIESMAGNGRLSPCNRNILVATGVLATSTALTGCGAIGIVTEPPEQAAEAAPSAVASTAPATPEAPAAQPTPPPAPAGPALGARRIGLGVAPGQDIYDLEVLAGSAGCNVGDPDPNYEESDKAIIEVFQRNIGNIDIDGWVFTETISAFNSYVATGQTNCGASAAPPQAAAPPRQGPSEHVKAVQTSLNTVGCDIGEDGIDGYNGPDTRNAAAIFARNVGIEVNGYDADFTAAVTQAAANRIRNCGADSGGEFGTGGNGGRFGDSSPENETGFGGGGFGGRF